MDPKHGIHLHRGRARGEGRHHHVADRLPAVQERHVLHPRPRRADRKGAVAHVDDREAGRTRRRHLGQPAADVPRGRRRLDDRQLRSRHQSRLLGHGPGQAVGAISARHRRRRALHEQHARARSEDRKDGVVLPAHPRRNARHGRGLRARARGRRRPLVGVLDGQAGDALGARSQDRQVRRRARPGIPDADRRRSEDRPRHVPRRTPSRKRAWSSASARAPEASRACARWRITRRRARSTSR